MLGAIIGDIAGSRFEFGSRKEKDFEIFDKNSRITDDSLMTIAVGCTCAEADLSNEDEFKRLLIKFMREIGRQYPDAGYGGMFYDWLFSDRIYSYGSFGNGSGMRVSPTAWAGDTIEEVRRLARWSSEVTHDHPEGIKGAEAIASAVFLARTGKSKEEIRAYIEENFYTLDFTCDSIRPSYRFDVTCQGSVPQAIVAFLESTDFLDAIRNAVSLGGDCDTIGCMAGSIAEAFYSITPEEEESALSYLDENITEYYLSYAEILYK